jgi:hypothetical protein
MAGLLLHNCFCKRVLDRHGVWLTPDFGNFGSLCNIVVGPDS